MVSFVPLELSNTLSNSLSRCGHNFLIASANFYGGSLSIKILDNKNNCIFMSMSFFGFLNPSIILLSRLSYCESWIWSIFDEKTTKAKRLKVSDFCFNSAELATKRPPILLYCWSSPSSTPSLDRLVNYLIITCHFTSVHSDCWKKFSEWKMSMISFLKWIWICCAASLERSAITWVNISMRILYLVPNSFLLLIFLIN